MIKDKRRLPHEYQPLLPDDETARLIEHAKNVDLDDATLENTSRTKVDGTTKTCI